MRVLRYVLMIALLCSIVMAAQPTSVAAAQSTVPRFEAGKCQFRLSAGQVKGKTVCGMVTVAEDHAKPDGKTITLPVAVFKSLSDTPEADPVVYLEGGPGGFTLASAGFYAVKFAPFRQKRDVILFDQRGTGFAKPSLYCPEVTDLYNELLNQELTPEESTKRDLAANLACHKRLVDSGIDLSHFNSTQNAADVSDILQALGYKQANLYGISYGTRLALTVMRDHSEGIRSVILDSVVPLEVDRWADQAQTTQRAFKTLFASCAADANCNKTFPNLEKVFYQVVDKLKAKPVLVTVNDQNGGASHEVMVDNYGFIGALFQAFYLTSEIPRLPAVIYAAQKGNLNEIASLLLLSVEQNDTFSIGLYWSTECREEMPYTTLETVDASAKDLTPQLRDYALEGNAEEFALCKAWGVGKGNDNDNQPVKSDIPTLVIEDTFDPVTPPAYGKRVAETLTHSYYYEIPNAGHGASLAGSCQFGIVRAFIDQPTVKPNDACIASIGGPAFVTK